MAAPSSCLLTLLYTFLHLLLSVTSLDVYRNQYVECLDDSYPKPTAVDANKTTMEIGLITGTYRQQGNRKLNLRTHIGSILYGISRPLNGMHFARYRFALRFCETADRQHHSVRHMAHICEEGRVSAVISHNHECRTLATIAAAYNIPLFSVTCDDPGLSDKKRFPTFTRVRPQPGDIAKIIVSLLRHFNWTKVALVTPQNEKFHLVTKGVRKSFNKHNVTILHHEIYDLPYDHPSSTQYASARGKTVDEVLRDTYETARIYVILGSHLDTLSLVHAMDKRKLLSLGKYFVVGADKQVNVDQMEFVSFWNKRGYLFSKYALRSYLHIRLRGMADPRTHQQLKIFSRYHLSQPPFNITQENNVKSSSTMTFLVDAVLLYITTIGRLISRSTFNTSQLRNGTLVSSMIRGRRYQSSMGYQNRIDNNGDTEGNYTVFRAQGIVDITLPKRRSNTMNVKLTNKILNMGIFFMSENITGLPTFQQSKRATMQWVGGRKPLDEPPCGFDGQLCKRPKDITYQVALGVIGGVALVLCIIAVFFYRNHRFEQELDMLLWKIDYKDLAILTIPDMMPAFNGMVGQEFDQMTPAVSGIESDLLFSNNNTKVDMTELEENEALLHSKSGSTVTTRSVGSLIMMAGYADLEFGKMYAPVAKYKKQIVAVKRVYKTTVNVNRIIKKELKILRDVTNQTNQNLTKFLGACVDEGKICAVWEYCERGSLQDILYNEELSLEPMFIASLVCDLLNGLAFLHDSELHCHGNLKSSNCVVDSRWTLKLTDFGLLEFKHGESVNHIDEDVYFYGLFWTAPELLRYMVCWRPYSSLSEHMIGMAQALKESVFDREAFHTSAPDWTALMRADIYALGIVLYEIYSRKRPFFPHNDTPFEIVRRVIVLNDEFHVPYRPKLSELSTVDKNVTDCIEACWAEQSAARPTAKQARTRLKDVVGNRSRNIFDNMMNLMETYAKNLERLVNERTGQLVEEKKRTEELLYQMLPVPVAEQLKRNKKVEAEAFDSVTIYFSDIVGFTELSADSTPFEVVQLLNDLYTTCDQIIANYDVYKVETIGDAYMVVSGVPRRYNRHAGEIADMSMNMLEVITSSFKIRHRPGETLKLRIGINSGACCAGVVGTKMPRFCLFGDTVNMASRMESNGEPCKIHISEQCKQELDLLDNYIVLDRGEIQIKGRGSIRTYWLYGKRTPTGEIITPFDPHTIPFSDHPKPPANLAVRSATPPPPTTPNTKSSRNQTSKGNILTRSFMSSSKSSRNRAKSGSNADSNHSKSKSANYPKGSSTVAVIRDVSQPVTEIVPRGGTLNSVCMTDGAPV